METIILVIHVLLCLFLVGVILLQAGKGAEMGAAFGGASQTLFGSRGPATFLTKITTGVAIFFLVTSIWLAEMSKQRSMPSSVLDSVQVPETTEPVQAPTPEAAPTAPVEEKK
ncbi:MAG: preprotein translocase subunit SecG [Deltaproteobacteria bacterium]|nr:preprotein translocase subunit SecG [Deltaproteobacteria bacterium]